MSPIGIKYCFDDLGDVSCAEIAQTQKSLLLGRIAVNTSFDSGLLSRQDWPKIGEYCQTPVITEELALNWQVSHDDFFDEWWVFDRAAPPDFKVIAFCNYGMSITRYKELDFDNGCPLDRYLQKFRPIAVFGNNQVAAYLIQMANKAQPLSE